MEAEPYEAVDSRLRKVRRKLDQLAHYRALNQLSEPDQLQYQGLCQQEQDLLHQLSVLVPTGD
jgi:hypothetical protein